MGPTTIRKTSRRRSREITGGRVKWRLRCPMTVLKKLVTIIELMKRGHTDERQSTPQLSNGRLR